MTSQYRNILRKFKKFPLLARIDWQLYLLRDGWSTFVWKRTRQVETPFGFKLATKAHPAYELMRIGKFEPEETRIFLELLRIADVFIDVGANVGYYCCLALQHGKPAVAFEPQLQNLACLYQNLTINGWEGHAEVFPVALSSSPALLPLFGASGPSASLVQNWAGYSPRYQQLVPANTLDHMLAGRFLSQRLIIKIDVEGAEYQVLSGAFATLTRQPRPIWLIEVCLTEYHPKGINPDYEQIFQLFWDHGYVCVATDEERTLVQPADVARWLSSGVRDLDTFNYIFIDPDTHEMWVGSTAQSA